MRVSRLRLRAAASLSIRIGFAVLSYLFIVILARWMSATEYGWYAIGISLATIATQIVGMGQPTAILRFWPAYLARDEPRLALGALRTGSKLTIAGAVIGTVLCAAIAVGAYLFHAPVSVPALLATAGLIGAMTFAEFWANALLGMSLVISAFLPRDILWRLLIIGVAGLYVLYGWKLSAATALNWSTAILLALVGWQVWYLHRRIPAELRGLEPETRIPEWRKTWYGLWGVVAVNALLTQFDPVIVGAMVKSSDAGLYFAAARTATLLTLMLMSANLVTSSMFSAYYHKGDKAAMQELCRSVSVGLLISTVIGYAGLYFFATQVMGLFGARFAVATTLLKILAIGYAVNSLTGPTGQLMLMSGRERVYLRFLTVGMVAKVPILVIGVHYYGLIGGAVADAIVRAAWNIGQWFFVYRNLGIDASALSLLGWLRPRRIS